MCEAVRRIQETLGIDETEADLIIDKAIAGGEIGAQCPKMQWLEQRLLPNIVMIDEAGYARMCVDALKILSTTAATDYGASRQRDLGQLWADMTRGYLGEYAFTLFMQKKWDLEPQLAHEPGELQRFLPMDIHLIREKRAEYRSPRIRISVKTTKWNGIWLDIPGDQFNHSDVHVLVKVGTGRDHLFAFFKAISVFKDKILKRGEDVGSLTVTESENLFNALPSFRTIPAYVCGFALKAQTYTPLNYAGKKGRKHYTITSWNGPISPGDLATIKTRERVTGKVSFESIRDFAHDRGYLFNTGNLHWRDAEWDAVRARI